MEAIASFASKSPKLFSFAKLMISTAVGFAAKGATEGVMDRLAKPNTTASVSTD